MVGQLVESWQIHNRINLYLLDGLPKDGLNAAALSKGRSVGRAFAHMHNVRLMWLEAARNLLEDLKKFEPDDEPSTKELKKALEASGKAIEKLLTQSLEQGGKIKGFKPHAAAFLGYLIFQVPPDRLCWH
ncbi:MAG: DinB family protein [Deinococcus sp.]|nr:DinB family protein [Deinococcus sp.]